MSSLQDQLIKAGLSNKQKARQANTEKKRKNKQKRSGANVDVSLQEQVKKELELTQKEKQARDQALNLQKKAALAEKERVLRIQQILEHHQVPLKDGELEFNYTDDKKIKKLYLDSVSHKALVNGKLAICSLLEKTYIVTAETAEKVTTLDEHVVLLLNDKLVEETIDEDDPYAEFQIPDDLMW